MVLFRLVPPLQLCFHNFTLKKEKRCGRSHVFNIDCFVIPGMFLNQGEYRVFTEAERFVQRCGSRRVGFLSSLTKTGRWRNFSEL